MKTRGYRDSDLDYSKIFDPALIQALKSRSYTRWEEAAKLPWHETRAGYQNTRILGRPFRIYHQILYSARFKLPTPNLHIWKFREEVSGRLQNRTQYQNRRDLWVANFDNFIKLLELLKLKFHVWKCKWGVKWLFAKSNDVSKQECFGLSISIISLDFITERFKFSKLWSNISVLRLEKGQNDFPEKTEKEVQMGGFRDSRYPIWYCN